MSTIILQGDALAGLKQIADKTVYTCVTSPPYWGLRDYAEEGQLGLESDPLEYVDKLVEIFREVHRVLRDDATIWLNLGDSYAGSGKSPDGGMLKKYKHRHLEKQSGAIIPFGMKPKDLVGIPWMVAFALRADGWYLRSEIIWKKNNCRPESVKDRVTRIHETIFLLSKNRQYYYDIDAIREPHTSLPRKFRGRSGESKWSKGGGLPNGERPHSFHKASATIENCYHPLGRNKRSVWAVSTHGYKGAHFAVFPQQLIEPCILAGCPKGGIVLDPFLGSGTTVVTALKHGRNAIGCELNPEYVELAKARIKNELGLFAGPVNVIEVKENE